MMSKNFMGQASNLSSPLGYLKAAMSKISLVLSALEEMQQNYM